ncbi:hypothetical protein H9P43_007879 [Blastocladiella emersonii ATCC 22665]|nr:hypothetical protein H9P43_007879 [Blastocladiella emersonii ATCC 22665]
MPRELTLLFLGASLPLGAHLIYVNSQGLIFEPTTHRVMLVLAACFMLANQVFFAVVHSVPGATLAGNLGSDLAALVCNLVISTADLTFVGFQVLSTTILVIRTTRLTPRRWLNGRWCLQYPRRIARAILLSLFAVGTVLIVLTCIFRTVRIGGDGFCYAYYDMAANNAGKLIYCVVYAAIVAVLAGPPLLQLRESARRRPPPPSLPSAPTSALKPTVVPLAGSAPQTPRQSLRIAALRNASNASSVVHGTPPARPSPTASAASASPTGTVTTQGVSDSTIEPHSPSPSDPTMAAAGTRSPPSARDATRRALERAILGMAWPISAAILVYLVTALLGLGGVWDEVIFIQFTVQNYAAMYASTYSAAVPAEILHSAPTVPVLNAWWARYLCCCFRRERLVDRAHPAATAAHQQQRGKGGGGGADGTRSAFGQLMISKIDKYTGHHLRTHESSSDDEDANEVVLSRPGGRRSSIVTFGEIRQTSMLDSVAMLPAVGGDEDDAGSIPIAPVPTLAHSAGSGRPSLSGTAGRAVGTDGEGTLTTATRPRTNSRGGRDGTPPKRASFADY